jgi:hypothetical protein
MSDLKLTQKQEKYCLNILQGLSQHDSYLGSYECGKMLPATIDRKACELMKNGKVRARIAELRKRLEDSAVMTKLEILKRHSEFARTNLTDFMELGQDGSWVNIGKETPNAGAIAEIHSRTEYDEDGAHPTVYTSVKLCDRQKSMSEICKILGFYQQPDMPIEDNRQVNFIFVLPDGTRIAPSKLTGNNTQRQLFPPDK